MNRDLDEIRDAMIELAAGRLTGNEAESVRVAMEKEPALREEYPGLQVLVHDLEEYGDHLVADLPAIDVAGSVMQRIKEIDPESDGIVPFVNRKRPARRWLRMTLTAAAAAAILLALWYGSSDHGRTDRRISQGPGSNTGPGNTVGPDQPDTAVTPPTIVVPGTGPGEVATPSGPESPEVAPEQTPEKIVLAEKQPSVNDVIEQRRLAAKSDEARQVLARWAALAPENAKAVLDKKGASADAIIGAALSLGGKDSVPFLQTAVEQNPDDPYLNLQLASASDTPYKPELDENNALGWYMYARELLAAQPPDVEGALKALATAGSYAKANAYSLDAAKYHEQALIASGMPADSAHLLTALTAGSGEYQDMVDLGMDLLDYGQYFQDLGDTATAQAIVEAVQRFGEQLNNGALFSNEQYAGLEIQDAALQVLNTIYPSDQMAGLAQSIEGVAAGFDSLVSFIGNVNDFFSRNLPQEMWQVIADIILQQGDLQLFNNLPSQ